MDVAASAPRPPTHESVTWLVRLAIACFLAYAVLLISLSREGFPTTLASNDRWPFLADQPIGDDGYYMMTVAWNIGGGDGITYNFGQPTTGIQPLATFIFAGLAAVVRRLGGDRFDLARAIIGLGVLAQLLLSHLVGRLGTRLARVVEAPGSPRLDPKAQHVVYSIAFVLVLCNTSVFAWATYGLETCFYLCLLCLFVARFFALMGADELSLRDALGLGALVGVAVLARLDFVVLSPVLLLLLAWRWRSRLPRLLLAGLVALLLIVPWLAYVYQVSGSPVPSSGYAQSGWPRSLGDLGERLVHAAVHCVAPSLPWAFNPLRGMSGTSKGPGELVLYLMPVLLALPALVASPGFWTTLRRLLRTLRPVLVAFALLTVAYVVLIRAKWFYPRYLLFWIVVLVPMVAILIARAGLESRRPLLFPSLAIVVALASFLYGMINAYNAGQLSWEQPIFAGLVNERFRHQRVGAFQSGVIGYYNPNTFNLDGKLDHVALRYLKQGKISGYIEEKRIDVLIDWDQQFETFMASPEERAYLARGWQRFALEDHGPSARRRFQPSWYFLRRPAPEPAAESPTAEP